MTKTFTFVAILTLIGVPAMGQYSPISTGSMILSGNIYFQSQSGDLYESTIHDPVITVGAVPSVGYFVAPGVLLGANMLFSHMSQGGNHVTAIGFGPMVGYYYDINPMKETIRGSIYPYVVAFMDYQHVDLLSDEYSFSELGGKIGLAAMMSESVALDLGARLSSVSRKMEDDPESVNGAIVWVGAGITAFIY